MIWVAEASAQGCVIRTYRSRSEQDTSDIAAELGSRLAPGALVLLMGGLGVGKTVFVRGLARGLGVDPELVSSPTFTIVHEYPGRVPLYHVDLYRLAPDEVDDIGVDQLGEGRGVIAVEWADRWPHRQPSGLSVTIADAGGDERNITIVDDGAEGALAPSP